MKQSFLIIFFLLNGTFGWSQKLQAIDLRGQWRFTIGDRSEYADVDFDDSNWETILVPNRWEYEGFANYNGYAWYRYHFDGYDLTGKENLTLNLGYIDDVHEVYLNGELLGFKGSFPPNYYTAYDALNEYPIPESIISRKGKNVLAVKVYDLTQDGGIVKGRNIGIWYSPTAELSLNLEGIWKFTTRKNNDWYETSNDDSKWGNILVPSFWKSKHIKWTSRSKAYYRKEFYLTDELKGKDLLLYLGKIDDFDRTYINGKLIGITNDGKPFGQSESYSKYRIYRISRHDLNQNGFNVLAIEVEDIGIDAGIYQGPIGLAPE